MKEALLQFVEREALFQPGDTLLLAVSGGLDSTVMAHLLHTAGVSIGIAHCNFQLRGAESAGDAYFVRSLATGWGVPYFEEQFDTRELAGEQGVSIQVMARRLRYHWLEQIRQQHHYACIATAHHLNDRIETVLFNFAKGCGLRGLLGIPVRNGNIVRPLLFATRRQLETYAKKYNLSFREDRSNRELKYDRNKIRQQVVPVLQQINPAFEATVAQNLVRLTETQLLHNWSAGYWRDQLGEKDDDRWIIDYEQLRKLPFARTLLHEWLDPLGFHSAQLDDLVAGSPSRTGASFEAEGYVLIVDRNRLILARREEEPEDPVFTLQPGQSHLELSDGYLRVEAHAHQPSSFPADPFSAWIDRRPLAFPLRVRHWRPGDVFCPLGMEGHRQKLQDLFANQKVDRLLKKKVWILENGDGRICWVIGYRLDDRFRIQPDTKDCLFLQFQKSED